MASLLEIAMRKPLETSRDLGDGNTNSSPKSKQVTQLKNWFFTWNNYPDNWIELLETTLRPLCQKYILQEEKGANGTPHLQGCLFLKKKMRWSQFGLPKEIHFEKTRNAEASVAYCMKDATRNGKTITFGLPKPIKVIETLYPWQENIEKIILAEPNDRQVYWYWENKGGIGKSAFVKYCVVKHRALFCDGGKKSDIINLVFNNDMDSCNLLIWDIPRSSRGSVSYSAIESIKNGLVCNTKYETGVKMFNAPHIICFANFPPDKPDELSEDRWNITEL